MKRLQTLRSIDGYTNKKKIERIWFWHAFRMPNYEVDCVRICIKETFYVCTSIAQTCDPFIWPKTFIFLDCIDNKNIQNCNTNNRQSSGIWNSNNLYCSVIEKLSERKQSKTKKKIAAIDGGHSRHTQSLLSSAIQWKKRWPKTSI